MTQIFLIWLKIPLFFLKTNNNNKETRPCWFHRWLVNDGGFSCPKKIWPYFFLLLQVIFYFVSSLATLAYGLHDLETFRGDVLSMSVRKKECSVFCLFLLSKFKMILHVEIAAFWAELRNKHFFFFNIHWSV